MRRILLSVLILFACFQAKAQFQANRLTFGGGLGMQFGNYTSVNIAPQVGYTFTNWLNAGAGFSYTYYKYKDDDSILRQSNNYLGFNVYARVYPVSYLVFMIQPEITRMWQTTENKSTHVKHKTEEFVPICLVGGGLRFGPVTAMIQYDLVQRDYSPYGNTIFYNIGYTFGF